MAKHLIFFAVTIGVSWAQTGQPSILENASLPPELGVSLDPSTVEAVQNKTINDIKARCEKYGGPEAYGKLENAKEELQKCISKFVNISSLEKEVEDAKPNGRVDEVFKKYCDKKPLFEGCVKNFTEASKACISEKEQGHLKTVYNVSQQLAEFICFKEGDRIALFIAEGGQECFRDKQEDLRDCANKTIGGGLNKDLDISSVSDATITFDEKQCRQMLDLQNCVVKVLETCPKPTSANIVESLFKFIRKATPCKNFADGEGSRTRSYNHKSDTPKKDSAERVFVTFLTLVSAYAVTLLL